MDIQSSLADFALLSARLADPFAQRGAVLAAAATDEAEFQRVAQRWSAHFLERPADADRFAELFCEARHPRSSNRTSSGSQAIPRAAVDPDQTMMATPVAPRADVLPFQEGTFEPAPIVVEKKQRPAADPDATQVPFVNPDDTLPFPRPTPKKRKT